MYFVINPNLELKKFDWSEGNEGEYDRCKEIISHMEDNFKNYSNPTTKGIDLKCEKKLMFDWVKYRIGEKSSFIIACNHHNDFEKNIIQVFPTEVMDKYFKISGKYRKKKSGSRKIPKRDFSKVKSIVESLDPSAKIFIKKEKTFAEFKTPPPKKYISEYYLGKNNEVRQTSNTNNPNVIFSLKFSPSDDKNGLDELINHINKL